MFALFECCEFDGQNCWSVCVLIFGPSQLVQEGAQGRARVKGLEQRESLLIRRSYNGSPVQQIPKTCSLSDWRGLLRVQTIITFRIKERFFTGPLKYFFLEKTAGWLIYVSVTEVVIICLSYWLNYSCGSLSYLTWSVHGLSYFAFVSNKWHSGWTTEFLRHLTDPTGWQTAWATWLSRSTTALAEVVDRPPQVPDWMR
jgi:hypothetical protein